jgi:hypothetical protein
MSSCERLDIVFGQALRDRLSLEPGRERVDLYPGLLATRAWANSPFAGKEHGDRNHSRHCGYQSEPYTLTCGAPAPNTASCTITLAGTVNETRSCQLTSTVRGKRDLTVHFVVHGSRRTSPHSTGATDVMFRTALNRRASINRQSVRGASPLQQKE